MLSYAKSVTTRPGDQLNGFKNGKTQQFISWGDIKWAYFQKKWSVPLKALYGTFRQKGSSVASWSTFIFKSVAFEDKTGQETLEWDGVEFNRVE